MNKVNNNNGSLSLTGQHEKICAVKSCINCRRRQYVQATIYAANIGINYQRRQCMPGDNLCRYTCLLPIVIATKGAVVVECLSCGAKGPGFDSWSRHLNFRDWAGHVLLSNRDILVTERLSN